MDITGSNINTANQVSPDLRSPDLRFRGGKILKDPEFSPIFLGKYWTTTEGKAAETKIGDFAKKLFNSSYMKLWAEYGAGPGTISAPVEAQTTKDPKRVSDKQIQQLISKQISDGSVPAPDGERVYTVFLSPGAELVASDGTSSLDGMGGYHMSFDLPDGKRVYYAAIVHSDDTNGVAFSGDPLDNITVATSHEWTEAATDPDVNNGRLGWYSDRYGEVADIPISMGMDQSDIYDRVDGYAVQKEWSNKDNRAETAPQEK